jgi:hypothetical protein
MLRESDVWTVLLVCDSAVPSETCSIQCQLGCIAYIIVVVTSSQQTDRRRSTYLRYRVLYYILFQSAKLRHKDVSFHFFGTAAGSYINAPVGLDVSVCPRVTTRNSLKGFAWYIALGVLDIFRFLLNSDSSNGHFAWRSACASSRISSGTRQISAWS